MELITPRGIRDMRNNTAARNQVVQVIDVRRLAPNGAALQGDRYRLVISDGENFQQAMVATQLNEQMQTLANNALIRLDNWTINVVSGRPIVIVMGLTILHAIFATRLGNPVDINLPGDAAVHQQQPPQQMAPGAHGHLAPHGGGHHGQAGGYEQQQQPAHAAHSAGGYGGAPPEQHYAAGGYQQHPASAHAPSPHAQVPPQRQQPQQYQQQQQGYQAQPQHPQPDSGSAAPAYGGGAQYGQQAPQAGGYGCAGQQQQQQYQQQPQQYQQQQQPQYGGGGGCGGGGGGGAYSGGHGGGQQQQQGGGQYGYGGGGQGGHPQQQQQQQQHAPHFGGGNGPVARASADDVGMRSIADLNPFVNRWTIKGRVTSKGAKKTYVNNRGEGSLFSFTLCDADGDIRLTAFNEQANQLHAIVHQGDVLMVRHGQIKNANERYNTTNSKYEISLSAMSEVSVVTDPQALSSIPRERFDVKPIASLAGMQVAQGAEPKVDVLGAIVQVGDVTTFTSKAGKEMTKRVVTLADDSGASIELTIWGAPAHSFAGNVGDIGAVKGARLSDWSGRSLSTPFDGDVSLHPDHPHAAVVKAWFDSGGAHAVTPLSTGGSGGRGGGPAGPRLPLAEQHNLGMQRDKHDMWSARATVMLFVTKKDPWYTACPKCKKKVQGDDAQGWSCEACQWSDAACVRRYVGRFMIADAETSLWVDGYDEAFVQLLTVDANELSRLKDVDERQYDYHVAERCGTSWVFSLKSRMEEWNGEVRQRHSVLGMKRLDYVEESRLLLEALRTGR